MVDKSTVFKIHISICSHYDFKTFSIHCQIKWEGYITFDSDINNLKADIGNIISIYCLVSALDFLGDIHMQTENRISGRLD